MRKLGSTLASLITDRAKVADALKAAVANAANAGMGSSAPSATPLQRVTGFGSNPGALDMYVYVPPTLAPRPGLVVVLHGCRQTASGYNDGAGWSALADRHGFVLLFPLQARGNNQYGCFNWFEPADTTRDSGEVLSIRQMVERAVADHGIDTSRVFVTGLSAGGAMAASLLAAYPDIFAAGGIIAGLPHGAASNVQTALASMSRAPVRPASSWGDSVRAASPHTGPWPRVSIWHGDADAVVRAANAAELVKQWTDVHGLPAAPSGRDGRDGFAREVWRTCDGRTLVESVTIHGMGHGTPLAVGSGEMEGGAAAAFMLDVGVSSSHHIAEFFGVTDWRSAAQPAGVRSSADSGDAKDATIAGGPASAQAGADRLDWANPDAIRSNVASVIQKALKSAGLAR